MKSKAVSFCAFQLLLKEIGYSEKRSEKAWIFHHPKEGLLVFRLYGVNEAVDERDLIATRKFLDFRGLLDATQFDAFLHQTTTPA